MGLFGFGKKKKQTNAVDEVFKQYGLETNDAKSPEKQTRRESAEAAASARESQNKKDNILERMNSLRKLLYRRPEFDRHSALLEECIQKLKGMPDNANKLVLSRQAKMNDLLDQVEQFSYMIDEVFAKNAVYNSLGTVLNETNKIDISPEVKKILKQVSDFEDIFSKGLNKLDSVFGKVSQKKILRSRFLLPFPP